MLQRSLSALMGLAARRPLAVGLAVGLLALLGAGLALRLEPTAGTDTLVDADTPEYRATEALHDKFGADAVYVLVRQELKYSVQTSDLARLVGLEGCLAGNPPAGATPRGGPDGPCAKLAERKPVQVLFGPGTFLNEAIGRIGSELGRQTAATQQRAERAEAEARKLARQRGYSRERQRELGRQAAEAVQQEQLQALVQLAVRYGLGTQDTNVSLNNPSLVGRIVFDQESGRPAGTPKSRFAYIFPSRDAALIQIRLRPDLTDEQRTDAIALIRQAVAMPDWKLPNGGGRYLVTGAPVVASDLAGELSTTILALLGVALLVMAFTLLLVFRARRPLLPLLVALAATAITFGALSLVGASLTMASIGVLPVLIGLAVDYAIQLQARVEEEDAGDLEGAVARVARRGAPTVATAAAATAAGFAVLVLSPVPMVRGFGAVLVLGIAIALLCALTLGVAGHRLGAAVGARPGTGRRRVPGPLRDAGALLRDGGAALAAAGRGARELALGNRAARAAGRRAAAGGRGALRTAVARPGRVLAIAAALAVAGWALDTQTRVESDLVKLVPRDGAVADLETLQRTTGVGGEVDVVVSADDLTKPEVVRWMADYQQRLLERFGYSQERGCGQAELCPAFSLPDLFNAQDDGLTREGVRAVLDAVPPYFSQGVITADRTTATLAFGLRLMPLDRQKEILDAMRAELDPPAGVRAELAGLAVLVAEANADVSAPWRRALSLVVGLAAVALVLLLAFRSRRRALLPLVPIALATGWSALVLFGLRIPLNPMSVTMGALVIAIATEFSVLLSERYRAERRAGHDPATALARTYASTGRAVLASGATAIAGFAVLVATDITMLRQFGAVTVIDLAVSLAGVLVVLPAVLILAERREALALPRPRLRRPGRPRLRRPGRPRLPRPGRATARA